MGLSTKTRHSKSQIGLNVASPELLARFEVSTTLMMKIQVFWIVALSSSFGEVEGDTFVRNVGNQ
jgi:hypothetical protein